MLAGEAVVAIWNGIAPEARAQFYGWHINEHMPERVGIPGFLRGRRYAALDASTHPEFFTLYEADTIEVLQGSDYANRLNNPTPATKATTAQFRNTSRALARVLETRGPGAGGVMLTIRFDTDERSAGPLATAVREVMHGPRLTGAHLCQADQGASAIRTAETRDRADIEVVPNWFVLLEATDAGALTAIDVEGALIAAGARGPLQLGLYRLEYTRNKTRFAA